MGDDAVEGRVGVEQSGPDILTCGGELGTEVERGTRDHEAAARGAPAN